MTWNVKMKKKYLVASSAMVLKRIETPSPAFFDRAMKNRVNEKLQKSEVSIRGIGKWSARDSSSHSGPLPRTKDEGGAYIHNLGRLLLKKQACLVCIEGYWW